MSSVLRPPSSINDLRTQAHLQLSARLRSLDLTKLLVMSITGVDQSILPYLVWQWDMSIPAPALEYFGVSLTTIVQYALRWHQYLGSVQTLLDVLALCGYPGSYVLEGETSWGGATYPSNQQWAVFRVVLVTSGTPSATDLANLTTIINFFKPARDKLDSIVVSVGASFADDEVPAGIIDGSNKNFTLAHAPTPPSLLKLFWNGVQLVQGTDYTLAGPNLSLVNAPQPGDSFLAFYQYGGVVSGALQQTPFGSVDGTNKTYVLTVVPNPVASLQLYLNGVFQQRGVDYTLVGNTITMTTAPAVSDTLNAFFRFGVAVPPPHYSDDETPVGVLNGSNVVFTLANAPNPAVNLQLYLNGLLQKQSVDYTLTGSTITYTSAPASGDTHEVFYRY